MNFNEWMHEWTATHKDKTWDEWGKEYARRMKKLLEAKWSVGFKDRGLGHGDFGVVARVLKRDLLIVECPNREMAEHIIEAHNSKIGK